MGGALIIEFDFHPDEVDKGDPTYPHLSVQYTPKGLEFYKYNQRQSAEHKYSIASKYLMKDILTDEQIHNVRVVYDPHFTELNFKEQDITRSQYLNRLLFSDLNDEYTYKDFPVFEKWNENYELGFLHIYIDDMHKPYMSTVINIGEMVERDNFFTNTKLEPHPDGSGNQYLVTTTGMSYISLSAST